MVPPHPGRDRTNGGACPPLLEPSRPGRPADERREEDRQHYDRLYEEITVIQELAAKEAWRVSERLSEADVEG